MNKQIHVVFGNEANGIRKEILYLQRSFNPASIENKCVVRINRLVIKFQIHSLIHRHLPKLRTAMYATDIDAMHNAIPNISCKK